MQMMRLLGNRHGYPFVKKDIYAKVYHRKISREIKEEWFHSIEKNAYEKAF